jgi:hypothetical protein
LETLYLVFVEKDEEEDEAAQTTIAAIDIAFSRTEVEGGIV